MAMRLKKRIRGLLRSGSSPGANSHPAANRGTNGYVPIEDYALIGDRLSAALVARDGSIDWACFPRMDSPSVFGRILDREQGGFCQLVPASRYEVTREYRVDTPILETRFTTGTGEALLIDFMPPQTGNFERLGDCSIVRIVRGVKGRVEMDVLFDPRFDYGRGIPQWEIEPGTGARAYTEREGLTFHSTRLEFARRDEGGVESRFETRPGEDHIFVLSYRQPPAMLFGSSVRELAPKALEHTEAHWREWLSRCTYDGPHAGMVRRSLLTLRLLDYALTGAIVAAPTTSLPETIGGIRNWDYRFCWIRDAAFTLYSFLTIGYPEEAENYLNWVLDVTRGDPRALRVLYPIEGADHVPEQVLDHLEGYRGSAPVRIGNGAEAQRQLDMYGEVLDCAWLMHRRGGIIGETLWELLRAIVDYVCEVWSLPDHGPWEVRSEPRHFVYSKVLCWVAVDRGVRLAEERGFACELDRWRETRSAIATEIETHGYKEPPGTYTAAYDGEDLDAALLALPLRRFVDANEPRMAATIERIRTELAMEGAPELLHRVSPGFEDGLHGDEGAFLLCSFWLADCLAIQDRPEAAEDLINSLMGHANDVGLFAEMYDARTGNQLGNFPQAFTHIALINALVNLHRAQQRAASTTAGTPGA
ncbi:MAG: glycoside hydrolase family 15 protein [Dehalococcoidia bacterium]|nr:glycoside hydrolase family 15 protein [Dehalococcoidia bacterium]